MAIGLVGRKCGMTRVFHQDGISIPVTVVEVKPNVIVQIKSDAAEQDVKSAGYNAIQVTAGSKKLSRVNKPEAGHFRKSSVEPGAILTEFRLDADQLASLNVGDQLTVEQFSQGQKVDVSGTSKGKGFAGVVKRYNFSTQDATHGNSLSHRAPGSTGQNQSPGRVFKGKKMAGQMGNVKTTVQAIEIVKVDAEKNIIMLKGALPGAPGGWLRIKPSVKA